MLWGAQFATPSFVQPTPEDRKVPTFVRAIRLGLLQATVVVQIEWPTPEDVAVPQAADMEDLLVRLAPGHIGLPPDTSRKERVSAPWASLAPLFLVHPLMVSPFLEPETAWHMMYTRADAMGMTQRVALFLDLLRAATVDP